VQVSIVYYLALPGTCTQGKYARRVSVSLAISERGFPEIDVFNYPFVCMVPQVLRNNINPIFL
jgi:hypothetical protein